MKNVIIASIAVLETEKALLQSQIDNFEYESSDEEYDEMLDSEGLVNVVGLEFYPSTILKECDPVAYRCGKSDYDSNIDLEEVEEYKGLVSSLEDLQSQIEDLESDLEDYEE